MDRFDCLSLPLNSGLWLRIGVRRAVDLLRAVLVTDMTVHSDNILPRSGGTKETHIPHRKSLLVPTSCSHPTRGYTRRVPMSMGLSRRRKKCRR